MKSLFFVIVGLFVLVGAVLWGGDILADRSITLAVVAPAPLYSLSPIDYEKSNPILSMVPPGQHLKVMRMRYGKDFQTFHVETETGALGWVIGGEGIKVTSAN